MDRTRHLLKSSILVIFLMGFGKLTGLLRLDLQTQAFGTGPEFDAFTAANQLPEVFFTLISGGALAAAFIPVYSRTLTDSRARSSARLLNAVLTLVLALLGTVSALGVLFAPWLARVILVPDFPASEQQLTAGLMRIILLQTTLFGLSGLMSSVLNAHQHFALPALAPISLDIGYFIGIRFLVPTYGIHGLAWGTVVGGTLHIAIQLPAIFKHGVRPRLTRMFESEGVREVVRLMGPRVITLGAIQLADIFIIRLTSGLPSGSTSSYFYSYSLMQLPETLFGTAIAIVMFPTMSELFNAGDMEGLKRISSTALRIIWTLTIPAALALILIGRPAIALFLQDGAFDAASTELVYGVLVFFSVRVVSEATLEILARLFFAQHNTTTPMMAALGWLVTSVLLAFALVRPLGARGLALAGTVAFTLQSLALYLVIRKTIGGLNEKALARTAGRSLAGCLSMAGAIFAVERLMDDAFLRLLLMVAAGLLSYFGTTLLLGGREIPDLIRLATNRGEKRSATSTPL